MSDESNGSSLTDLFASIFAQAANSDALVSVPDASTSTAADPIESLQRLIRRAQTQVEALSLISSNDSLDDLPTSSLRAVLLDSVYAQVVGQSQTKRGDFAARKSVLRQSKEAYRAFFSRLVNTGILSRSSDVQYVNALYGQVQQSLSTDKTTIPNDATNRRAAKIASMKLERALLAALDEYRTAYRTRNAKTSAVRSNNIGLSITTAASASLSTDFPSNVAFDLLIMPKRADSGEDDDGDDDDEAKDAFVGGSSVNDSGIKTPSSLRSYLIMLCHLHAVLALSALDSIYTEVTVLDSMPPEAELEAQRRAAEEERTRRQRDGGEQADWRLDQRWGASNNSPLLDNKGKPLRPFTILPSQGGMSGSHGATPSLGSAQEQLDARRRLQQQVFQPGHRLPTMTIDQFLDEEERRGNIIRGGGQASAEQPTGREMLALRAEGEGVGTQGADEADEEQRRKAVEWDEFAEANPKGIGNTMNRG